MDNSCARTPFWGSGDDGFITGARFRHGANAVENLPNALAGIHAGLSKHQPLPPNYAGLAIYCEWEMDQQEWATFKKDFEKDS